MQRQKSVASILVENELFIFLGQLKYLESIWLFFRENNGLS